MHVVSSTSRAVIIKCGLHSTRAHQLCWNQHVAIDLIVTIVGLNPQAGGCGQRILFKREGGQKVSSIQGLDFSVWSQLTWYWDVSHQCLAPFKKTGARIGEDEDCSLARGAPHHLKSPCDTKSKSSNRRKAQETRHDVMSDGEKKKHQQSS